VISPNNSCDFKQKILLRLKIIKQMNFVGL